MNFSAAKTFFSILSGIGWLLIIGGIIFVFLDIAPAAMAVWSGLIAAISGASLMAVAQMGIAQIVTAETNTKILAILNAQGGIPNTADASVDTRSVGTITDATPEVSPGRIHEMGKAIGRGLKRK